MGSIPGWGTKIPHATWCSERKIDRKKEMMVAWTRIAIARNSEILNEHTLKVQPIGFVDRLDLECEEKR